MSQSHHIGSSSSLVWSKRSIARVKKSIGWIKMFLGGVTLTGSFKWLTSVGSLLGTSYMGAQASFVGSKSPYIIGSLGWVLRLLVRYLSLSV